MATLAPSQPPASATRNDAERDLFPWRRTVLVIFAVSLLAGLVGMWMRLTQGHLPAGYGSFVPWGLWIAIYFHGVGVAAGAFAMSAAGYLAGLRGFRSGRSLRIAAVIVAATVAPALLAVALDLGQMMRAYRIIIDPSFTSMMAFNSWTYFALIIVAALVWFLSLREDRGWLRPLLVLGLLLSVMIPAQSGAFLAVVDTRTFWHTALMPVLMLTSGLVAGAAALLVVRAYLSGPGAGHEHDHPGETLPAVSLLRKVLLVGLAMYFFLEIAEFTIALWNTGHIPPEVSMILTGPYWWAFWIVHVLLGGIVPYVLLLTKRPRAWSVAAVLVVIGFISTRLNVLIPGQSVGSLEGLQEAYSHPRLDYVYNATLMEYLVALFCLALAMGLLYAGLRVTAAMEARTARKEQHHVSR